MGIIKKISILLVISFFIKAIQNEENNIQNEENNIQNEENDIQKTLDESIETNDLDQLSEILTNKIDNLENTFKQQTSDLIDKIIESVDKTINDVISETDRVMIDLKPLLRPFAKAIKRIMDVMGEIAKTINEQTIKFIKVPVNAAVKLETYKVKMGLNAAIGALKLLNRCNETQEHIKDLAKSIYQHLADCIPNEVNDNKDMFGIIDNINSYLETLIKTPENIDKCMKGSILSLPICVAKVNTNIALQSASLRPKMRQSGLEIAGYYTTMGFNIAQCFTATTESVMVEFGKLGLETGRCLITKNN